jgi:TnpA family transposase
MDVVDPDSLWRTQLDQDLNAMALNLVVAATTLWNTAYLDRALSALEEARIPVPSEYLPTFPR